MTSPSNPSHVVVGYDFSVSGAAALDRAIALAGRAPFHVLHFVYVIGDHDYQHAARVEKELSDEVGRLLLAADIVERVNFFVHVRIGKPADEILAVAREIGADFILVGSKGLTGVERFVLGSVAEKVVREAGCSVEVARPKSYERVELLKIVDADSHQKYTTPHRYTYENASVSLRPLDWPLY